jgi:hypothetical protein
MQILNSLDMIVYFWNSAIDERSVITPLKAGRTAIGRTGDFPSWPTVGCQLL